MKLSFSKDARSDLERLKEFIASKNPTTAFRIINEVIDRINKLVNFPDLGIQVKKAPVPDALRDLYILDYHIRYLKLSKTIIIVRVWHQKENR
ncbi:MAG: type II toxin-antitoxin system RelE/ParE family toxin [Marinicellaceae bacterium]